MTSFKWDVFWPWFNGQNPDEVSPRAFLCTPGGFQAYEHRWALGEAFDFHLEIGKKLIAERIHTLNAYCKKEMAHVPNLILYTPDSNQLSSGMICFDVKGKDPGWVVEQLVERKILTGQTPYRQSHCRLMPGLLNDFSELDKTLTALRDL